MTAKELFTSLGVVRIPENINDFDKTPAPVSICNVKNIEAIESRYATVGAYMPKLYECISALSERVDLLRYGNIAAAYMNGKARDSLDKISMPPLEENNALRFLPILIILAILPEGIREFKRRGFSEEEIYSALHGTFEARIALSERMTKKQGLDAAGFSWLRLYATASVFPAGIFNVTPKIYRAPFCVLKNESGELALVATGGRYHSSGAVLGTAGCLDEEGAFTAEYAENDEYIIAHPTINSLVSSAPVSYDKKEWRVIFRDGDGFAGIHIPRGADISQSKVEEGFRLALKLTRERYPEFSARGVYCASWMLSPTVAELCGEGSRLSSFANRFLRHPIKSDGNAVFAFVFQGKPSDLSELPEETSLQRKLKALYQDGIYLHAFGGFVPEHFTDQ